MDPGRQCKPNEKTMIRKGVIAGFVIAIQHLFQPNHIHSRGMSYTRKQFLKKKHQFLKGGVQC